MRQFATEKIIMFGIGNQNRGDDGAAWALLQLLEKEDFPAAMHYVYHLQIEHAMLIAHADIVIFIDATQGQLPDGYSWSICEPMQRDSVFSHGLMPDHLLYLTQELFGKIPTAYLLLLQGEDWSFRIALSEMAHEHVIRAYNYLKNLI